MKLTIALALSTSLITLSVFSQQAGGASAGAGASTGTGGGTGAGASVGAGGAGASVGTGGAGASVGTGGAGASVGTGGAAGGAGASGSLSVGTPATPSVGGQTQLQGGQPNAGANANASVGNGNAGNANQNQNQQNGNQQNGNQQAFATNQANALPQSQQSDTNAMTPTTRPGATNRVYATNSSAFSNGAPWLQRDQALTPQDQALLTQIRQAVFPSNQQIAGWMSSIHFILKDGAVRLVGTVPSQAERQRIEAIVGQIPGVVRVYDALAVSASAGFEPGAASAAANGGAAINGTVLPPSAGATNSRATAAPR